MRQQPRRRNLTVRYRSPPRTARPTIRPKPHHTPNNLINRALPPPTLITPSNKEPSIKNVTHHPPISSVISRSSIRDIG
jgi:hypothetical protein